MKALPTLAAATVLLLTPHAATADYTSRPEVQAYMDELSARHGFSRQWLSSVLARAQRKDSIIEAISRPAEKAKPWHEYRGIFVTDDRIVAGVDFWHEHAKAVASAQEQYGVAAEVVVAIIGVETYYGRYLGRYRVLDALSTLAFDYPPRAGFFRGELTEFLRLVREEGHDPLTAMGSYAGAMGYGQFIPSSYRAYAVDFDADGVRDIWTNKTDAIGSVANYFARHGWRGQGPAVVRVELGDPTLDEVANAGLELEHTVGALRARGVTGIDALPDDARAALFRMQAADGDEYWLGLHDFYVVTRYNRSAMYALAVLQLAAEIRGHFDAVAVGDG
ncbi:MAG: lytic murein transglycosylase B [Gammaproteobacteria bacterium]|nr:lytic murein transglycosylase B [Gammaproteobacteria bacterium]